METVTLRIERDKNSLTATVEDPEGNHLTSREFTSTNADLSTDKTTSQIHRQNVNSTENLSMEINEAPGGRIIVYVYDTEKDNLEFRHTEFY